MASARKGTKPLNLKPAASAAAPSGAGGGDDLLDIARGLAAAVSEHNLSELIIETPDVTFTLRRGGVPMVTPAAMPPMPMPMPMPAMAATAPTPAATAATAAAPAAVDDKAHIVKSPFVGTFYRKPNPDSPDYVKVNDKVSKGQVLCIVEAMKLMNEIESDIAGTLIAVLAEDGAPVEYDQPLFKIAVS